jgi:TolB-like protein
VRHASASSLNPALPEKSIDALSFEKLNREPDSAFLAHEMNDNLLTKLAKIADMKVGRTATTAAPFVETDQTVSPSVEQYRTAPKIVKARHWHKRVVIAVRLSQQAPGFCEEEMIRNARVGATLFIGAFLSVFGLGPAGAPYVGFNWRFCERHVQAAGPFCNR